MAATKARKETEQGQGFQFIAVFHGALKPERKVILKHPFTGLLSGGLEAKRAALGPQSSQEVHFPKCDSWLDVPTLLFSAIIFFLKLNDVLSNPGSKPSSQENTRTHHKAIFIPSNKKHLTESSPAGKPVG